jgi:hypothetical protein
MLKIPQLVEWADISLGPEQSQLRLAEQIAWKIRNLLMLRYSVSAAILWIAADAYECDLWHTPQNDFESFELWLEFVFSGTHIQPGSTLWTIVNSFAVGISPWLKQNKIEDQKGQITPERVLEDAGYSLLQDVNTMWWNEFKRGGPETDERIEKACRKIVQPGITRESIDTWLKEEGYRKSREERAYQFAEQQCSDGIAFIVMCSGSDDVDFVKGKLQRWLAMFPGRLQEVAPELVWVGEWGVEMIEEGMRE